MGNSKRIFLLLWTEVLLTLSVVAQHASTEFFRVTTDILYWNRNEFLMSSSPLSSFSKYKTLYPEVPCAEISSIYGTPLGNLLEKNYIAIWKLVDGYLYLGYPWLYTVKSREGNDLLRSDSVPACWKPIMHIEDLRIFEPLEQLVGERFSHHRVIWPFEKYMQLSYVANSILPRSPYGVIPATWVSGIFYIKKCRDRLHESIDRWNRSPYYRLIFEQGILVSVTVVNGADW